VGLSGSRNVSDIFGTHEECDSSGVNGGGVTAPGDTLQGQKKVVTFQEKINRGDAAELRDRQTVMTKRKKDRRFFRKKIGVTPSVAAPGDMTPLCGRLTNRRKQEFLVKARLRTWLLLRNRIQ